MWLLQLEKLPELLAALVFSVAIGTERQFRGKRAGVRTYALVGLGSALVMLVSKFGFTDILGNPGVVLDPSRIAAQIVSGVGFLGAGLIIFRSQAVRGLTTAASIWVTAAIGMASGAGLYLFGAAVTLSYFLVVLLGPWIGRLRHRARSELRIEYRDGQGLLRDIVQTITRYRWQVSDLRTGESETSPGFVAVMLGAEGPDDGAAMLDAVSALPGVRSVQWQDATEPDG